MIDKPKVSVVVPVYNTELFLSECLNSLIGQTYINIEIICVNDGSIDNSINILMEYARRDQRISIVDQANSGSSSARNVGMSRSSGDYVVFVDSDDILYHSAIEECVGIFAKYENIDAVYYNMEAFTPSGKRYTCLNGEHYNPRNSIMDTRKEERTANYTNIPLGLFKLSIIKKNKLGFNSEIILGDDWYFMNKYLIFCKNIYWYNANIYSYRKGFSNKTITSAPSKKSLTLFTAFHEAKSNFKRAGLLNLYEFAITSKILDESLSYYRNKLSKYADPELKNMWFNEMVKIVTQIPEPFYYALISSYSCDNKKIFLSIRKNNFSTFNAEFAHNWEDKLKIRKALRSVKKHMARVIEMPFKFIREILLLVICILRIIFYTILNFHKLFRGRGLKSLQQSTN